MPLFLAGGLASEVFSHGIPVVMASVPGYQVDLDTAITLQGLQFVALVQGQVSLGVALIALSFGGLSNGVLPKPLEWIGLLAGVIDLVRPFAVTSPPVLTATFIPTFVWIAGTSVVLATRRQSVRGSLECYASSTGPA